jgi:phenylacetate-CoA ligase
MSLKDERVYGRLYRDVAWPLYEKARGRRTHEWLALSRKSQWESPEAIRARQWTELQCLLWHAFEHCAWYRAQFRRLGISPGDAIGPEDFHKLPLVSKNDIRHHRGEMLADNYRDRVFVHRTGGSTGTPLEFFVSYDSYQWRHAMSLRGYGWAGSEEGDRHFLVWGAPIGTPPLRNRIKSKLHNAVLRRRLFSSFGFSEAGMAECARKINAFRPLTIIGYTNALVLLAQHILEHGPAIAPVRGVITAAEAVNDVQRQTIEKAFGAPVFASYGSREFMLIGMECEWHKGLHLSSENLYVELIKDGEPVRAGETGEVVVTDLHNFGMPFIRYPIGDLAIASERTCPCGRGLPLLERVDGRILDVIRTPDGRIVPGEFFPHLMKEFTAVKQFQVVQKRLDLLEINLVMRSTEQLEQYRRIEHEILNVLGSAITVHLQCVERIPESPSGKFRVTISEI